MVHCPGIPFFLFVNSCLSFCLYYILAMCCLSWFTDSDSPFGILSFISAIVKTSSTCVNYESNSWLFWPIIFSSICISWNITSVDESFLMSLSSLSFNSRWSVLGNILRILLLCLSVIGKDQMSCYATLLMINVWIDPASSQIIN